MKTDEAAIQRLRDAGFTVTDLPAEALAQKPHVAELGADPADWTCVLCDHGFFDVKAHPKVDGETVFRAYRP